MSKTILANTEGFTPVIDRILKDTGSYMTALVFGRIWRFCQMKDGVCNATLETLADGLGMSRPAVLKHARILVETGYLKDLTPTLRNHPHTYADTGKAGLHMAVSAGPDVNVVNVEFGDVHENEETVNDVSSTVNVVNASVHDVSLKKVFKKESIKKEKDIVSEKIEILDYMERVAPAIFQNHYSGWTTLAFYLKADTTDAHREDGKVIFTGLGMRAAMFQDRYALSFSRALAGIYNQGIQVIFEE